MYIPFLGLLYREKAVKATYTLTASLANSVDYVIFILRIRAPWLILNKYNRHNLAP